MTKIDTVQLDSLGVGSQFNMKGEPNTVWQITANDADNLDVMNLISRRIFIDFPSDLEVYPIPFNRRVHIPNIQVGDSVRFKDFHYGISGKGVVSNITYPNGHPVFHLDNLTEVPPGFRSTYVSPSQYVGDKIERVV